MRHHKKSRVYVPGHHFSGWVYRGYLICYGAEIINVDQLRGIGECDTDWFRSEEPWDGECVDDVKFDCRTGGWATINCIMDNVDDTIDEEPMDKFDGVDWMVSFRTGGSSAGVCEAVKITVPHWHVTEAREWVMRATGHYVSSMTRIFMGEQPRIIAREGKYEY